MKKTVLAAAILGIAALSFAAGRWLVPERRQAPTPPGERQVLYYVDPMNPGFRSKEPGIAPCGMPLEPFYADPEEIQGNTANPLPPGTVKVSTARQQLIGVRVAPADTGPLTHTLRLYGRVIPDENLTYRLNASTDSWIRKLSDVTTGDIVQKDEVLGEGLAPAYYNAQVTFMVALDNLDRINRQMGGQLRHNQADLADNKIRMAVQALQNLGITDAQIEELATTRRAQPYLQIRSPARGVVLERNLTLNQWFKAGEEFFTIADIGRVWVYADVYEDEARHLAPGMKVKVMHAQMGRTFDAMISQVLPLFDPVAKTLKVRLDVPNPEYELRPDMFLDVEIPITLQATLRVPADAVIDSGTQAVVYVDLGGGAFEPRKVTTGWRLGRQVQITDGLMPGERVVVDGNFLIDSESRMRASASGPVGEMSRDPVCGMYVNEEVARFLGRSATYGDRTWSFCMEECRLAFEKDPQKYVSSYGEKESGGSTSTTGTKRSWLEALESGRRTRGDGRSSPRPEPGKGSVFGTALTSRGVIDWDGPKPREGQAPEGEWKELGKFPGAKYLGLGDEGGETSGEPQGPTEPEEAREVEPSPDQPLEPASQ